MSFPALASFLSGFTVSQEISSTEDKRDVRTQLNAKFPKIIYFARDIALNVVVVNADPLPPILKVPARTGTMKAQPQR